MHFLVIEDDTDIRQMICKILKDEHHNVSEAVNGNDALKRLRQESKIDVIITDIIMPEKEGIETILEVKSGYPHIKILAISGGGKGIPQNYLDLASVMGADKTLSKPFIKSDLLKAIGALLAQK